MKLPNIIAILFFSIFIFACSSTKTSDIKPTDKAEKQATEQPQVTEEPKIEFEINSNLKNLFAKADGSIFMQGNNYSADLEIKIADNDSLSIIVSGAFGMTYGKVFSTIEKFILLNSFAGKVYTGNPESAQLSQIIGTNISIKNLMDIFKAKLLFAKEKYKFVESQNNENKFEYSDKQLQDYVILDQFQRIKAYSRKDKGQDIFRVNYYYSANKNDFNTLKSLKLFIPQATSSLELNFDTYNFLTDFKTPFSFKLPKNATIIKLD